MGWSSADVLPKAVASDSDTQRVRLGHNIVYVRTKESSAPYPLNNDLRRRQNWFNEGQFFYNQSEYDEAIKAYDEAIMC
jgi:hypothetical protein